MFTYAYFHPRRNLAKTGRGGGVGGGGVRNRSGY